MADTYQLSFTAEEIDERLAKAGNALLVTEQALTEEQKTQARANLGIEQQSGGTGGGMPVINLQAMPGGEENPTFLGEVQATAVREAFASGKPFLAHFFLDIGGGTSLGAHAVFAPDIYGTLGAFGFLGTNVLVLMCIDPESNQWMFVAINYLSPEGEIL